MCYHRSMARQDGLGRAAFKLWLGLGCLWLLLCHSLPLQAETQPNPTFEKPKPQVSLSLDKQTHTLWAQNREYAPYTFHFELTLDNARINCERPCLKVVPPRSEVPLLHFQPEHSGQPWHYHYRYHYRIGDYRAKARDLVYRLPFAVAYPVQIGQGYNGSFTHYGAHRFALDFLAPQGTPVYAARGGQVVWVVQGFSEGGHEERFKERANTVIVLHPDGSLGYYAHFQFQGVVVQPGQEIRPGSLLGYVGSTGYSSQPHLHFELIHDLDGIQTDSLPTRFWTQKGVGWLKQGETYYLPNRDSATE